MKLSRLIVRTIILVLNVRARNRSTNRLKSRFIPHFPRTFSEMEKIVKIFHMVGHSSFSGGANTTYIKHVTKVTLLRCNAMKELKYERVLLALKTVCTLNAIYIFMLIIVHYTVSVRTSSQSSTCHV